MFRMAAGIIVTLLALLPGCGKNSSSRSSSDGSPGVVGDILVGTQCPLGTLPKPVPGGFTLEGCPLDASALELATPPGPLLLSGDCAEMTLAIRSTDGSVDTLWQIPPDGSFSIVVPGFHALLAWEGAPSCVSGMTLEIAGAMSCASRDILSIRIDNMRLWMAPSSEDQRAIFGLPGCVLPQGCRLETRLELRQCG